MLITVCQRGLAFTQWVKESSTEPPPAIFSLNSMSCPLHVTDISSIVSYPTVAFSWSVVREKKTVSSFYLSASAASVSSLSSPTAGLALPSMLDFCLMCTMLGKHPHKCCFYLEIAMPLLSYQSNVVSTVLKLNAPNTNTSKRTTFGFLKKPLKVSLPVKGFPKNCERLRTI